MKFIQKKTNKFGAKRTTCAYGHNHPSKGEAAHCVVLHLIMKSEGSDILSIDYETPYRLEVNGVLVCKHVPDWTLKMYGGRKKIVEFKGMPTPAWKLKMALFKAIYPDIEYEVVYRK